MTGRERRVVAIGAAIVVGALVLRGAPSLVRSARGWREERALKQRTLEQRLSRIERLPALERRADSVKRAVVSLAGRFLDGGTATEAQADLVRTIEATVQRIGGTVVQVDPMTDSLARAGVRRVTVRATIEGDTQGVWDLVDALDTGRQLLLVRELRVDATGTGAAAASWEVVKAELVIEGWYQPRNAGLATHASQVVTPANAGVQRPSNPADSITVVGVFRPDRSAPTSRYRRPLATGPAAPAAAAAVPKPVLRLTGLVWSRSPRVVIDGLPGVEGSRVLAIGDTVAGIRVRTITAHMAELIGLDTTWVLRWEEGKQP